MCVFSQIKDRKHIEQNFHFVVRVMLRVRLGVRGESKKFSVGICGGALSTARSSIQNKFGFLSEGLPVDCFQMYEPKSCKALLIRSIHVCAGTSRKPLLALD